MTTCFFVFTALSTRTLIEAISGSEVEKEMKAVAKSRGASLRILLDPWGASTPGRTSSSSDDRIGRISLANLNRNASPSLLISSLCCMLVVSASLVHNTTLSVGALNSLLGSETHFHSILFTMLATPLNILRER